MYEFSNFRSGTGNFTNSLAKVASTTTWIWQSLATANILDICRLHSPIVLKAASTPKASKPLKARALHRTKSPYAINYGPSWDQELSMQSAGNERFDVLNDQTHVQADEGSQQYQAEGLAVISVQLWPFLPINLQAFLATFLGLRNVDFNKPSRDVFKQKAYRRVLSAGFKKAAFPSSATIWSCTDIISQLFHSPFLACLQTNMMVQSAFLPEADRTSDVCALYNSHQDLLQAVNSWKSVVSDVGLFRSAINRQHDTKYSGKGIEIGQVFTLLDNMQARVKGFLGEFSIGVNVHHDLTSNNREQYSWFTNLKTKRAQRFADLLADNSLSGSKNLTESGSSFPTLNLRKQKLGPSQLAFWHDKGQYMSAHVQFKQAHNFHWRLSRNMKRNKFEVRVFYSFALCHSCPTLIPLLSSGLTIQQASQQLHDTRYLGLSCARLASLCAGNYSPPKLGSLVVEPTQNIGSYRVLMHKGCPVCIPRLKSTQSWPSSYDLCQCTWLTRLNLERLFVHQPNCTIKLLRADMFELRPLNFLERYHDNCKHNQPISMYSLHLCKARQHVLHVPEITAVQLMLLIDTLPAATGIAECERVLCVYAGSTLYVMVSSDLGMEMLYHEMETHKPTRDSFYS